MLSSGAILLLLIRPRWPTGQAARLAVFSVVGLFGVQITFFLSIAYSNAATTTLLQSLSLPMLAGYEALGEGRRPSRRWLLAVGSAVVGTVLLVVGGQHIGLAVNPLGLLFGLGAAITAVVYILASRPLVREHGPWATTAWGFLIGGAASSPLGGWFLAAYHLPPGALEPAVTLGLVAFVVVAGTLVAFGLFLTSLGHIRPTEAGVAATMEPVSAGAAALVFLNVILFPLQYAGAALVLLGVYLIASRRSGGPSPPAPPP